MSENTKILNRNPKIEVEDLGDGSLMIYDENKKLTFILNDIMTIIWEKCDGRTTIDEVVDHVKNNFDISEVSAEIIGNECNEAINNLLLNDLLID